MNIAYALMVPWKPLNGTQENTSLATRCECNWRTSPQRPSANANSLTLNVCVNFVATMRQVHKRAHWLTGWLSIQVCTKTRCSRPYSFGKQCLVSSASAHSLTNSRTACVVYRVQQHRHAKREENAFRFSSTLHPFKLANK